MWEVVVLNALSKHGTLQCEIPLASRRRPDVLFEGQGLSFTADIVTVSDEGLDERNPFNELSDLIKKTKRRLGLKVGGTDIRVKARYEQNSHGTRSVLKLPKRKQLREFVAKEIEPQLRAQIEAGAKVLKVMIENEDIAVEITIDELRSPYSSAGFPAYDLPTIVDRNPLYSALREKDRQLRGAAGLVGVIVGDGDCKALSDRHTNWNTVSTSDIVKHFLRQYSSVQFVLILSIREDPSGSLPTSARTKRLHPTLIIRETVNAPIVLHQLFEQVISEMPKPVNMPVNAAYRARARGFDLGHHGGGEMSTNRIKISAREVLEVLAGRRSIADLNATHGWSLPDDPPKPNVWPNPFETHLASGRLPSNISIIKTGEDDPDDWIEIVFGDPDPAITPFR